MNIDPTTLNALLSAQTGKPMGAADKSASAPNQGADAKAFENILMQAIQTSGQTTNPFGGGEDQEGGSGIFSGKDPAAQLIPLGLMMSLMQQQRFGGSR